MFIASSTMTLDTYRNAMQNTYSNLSAAQFESLYHYTSTGYKNINQKLHQGSSSKHSENIQEIFNTAKLSTLTQTYRGTKRNNTHTVGEEIIFPTYTSTSVNPIEAYNFTKKAGTFYILKNVQGLAVSYDKKEMEILLPINTTFTVEAKLPQTLKLQYPDTDYGITVPCEGYILTPKTS